MLGVIKVPLAAEILGRLEGKVPRNTRALCRQLCLATLHCQDLKLVLSKTGANFSVMFWGQGKLYEMNRRTAESQSAVLVSDVPIPVVSCCLTAWSVPDVTEVPP